jgi:N-acetylglucosaminyldiphosphoundecaprenol N-acetyl-beta-D-mannosaminyltransferase
MSIMALNCRGESNDVRVRISGIPLTARTELEVLQAMDGNIKGKRLPQYIVITNTESMYYARRLHDHAEFIEGAAFSCCDGVGVVLAGRAQGVSVNRIYGSNLVKAACQFGAQRSWRHFFYGGRPGVPETLKHNLEACSPGMLTSGTMSPPFRPLMPEEDDAVVNQINDSGCDIVWVGLGLLKQERWIADHRDRIRAPWMVGVGAAFDYHAGTVARAPLWVQRVGFEWLHRVCHQPRMLVRNYRSFVFLGESLLHRSSQLHNSSTTQPRSAA